MICKHCGKETKEGEWCEHCEGPLTKEAELKQAKLDKRIATINRIEHAIYHKNKFISMALCFFLGYFGAHRFYEGKIITGVIWLLTGGLFGIGVFFDFLCLIVKPTIYNPLASEYFVSDETKQKRKEMKKAQENQN